MDKENTFGTPIEFNTNSLHDMDNSSVEDRPSLSPSPSFSKYGRPATTPSTKFYKFVATCKILFVLLILSVIGLFSIAKVTPQRNVGNTNAEKGQLISPNERTNFEATSNLSATITARNSEKNKLGSFSNPAQSCLHLRQQLGNESGYYVIRMDNKSDPFMAFCDLETSGGGWTLVSTVHENNIHGKCTSGDLWFSNEMQTNGSMASRNWENKYTFGHVSTSTSSDYKNPAYFGLQAVDVMVRHVPNGIKVKESKQNAMFEYHTQNGFLKNYGGNLYNVYNNYYPLTPESQVYYPQNINQMLDALEANASGIVSHIPDVYDYEYNENYSNVLRDGGSNMFTSYGMEIFIQLGRLECRWLVFYGRTYKCGRNQAVLSSRKAKPFFLLMGLGNYLQTSRYFYCRIRSFRPYADLQMRYSGVLVEGNYQMKYNAHCRYNTTSPSLCDVTYLVANQKDWDTSTGIRFPSPTLSVSSSNYYYYQYVENYPTNAVFGYTLFSRNRGRIITKNQTKEAMKRILRILTQFNNIAPPCANYHDNLVTPVNFTVGQNDIFSRIPPSVRERVNVGYLQIRARGIRSSTYALCPAVRVNSCESQFLCVGGVKRSDTQTSDCGDFLEWDGLNPQRPINSTHAVKYAHALQDIESTIMIFYR